MQHQFRYSPAMETIAAGYPLTMNPDAGNMRFHTNDVEVIKITRTGQIFWRGREVETDSEFRAAMLDLQLYFRGVYGRP